MSLKRGLTASFDRWTSSRSGEWLRGLSTGFKSLDSMLAGMQDSNLIVLASRPGVGKRLFSVAVARFVAVEEKLPTCVFSLEMSKEELSDRLPGSPGFN